jgi:hypothetical protein
MKILAAIMAAATATPLLDKNDFPPSANRAFSRFKLAILFLTFETITTKKTQPRT